MASEGPRATIKKRYPLTVGRGPVPRHRLALGKKRLWFSSGPKEPKTHRDDRDRGGQAPALRTEERIPFSS